MPAVPLYGTALGRTAAFWSAAARISSPNVQLVVEVHLFRDSWVENVYRAAS